MTITTTEARLERHEMPPWLNLQAIGIDAKMIDKLYNLAVEVTELEVRVRPLMKECRAAIDPLEEILRRYDSDELSETATNVSGVEALRSALFRLRDRVESADEVVADCITIKPELVEEKAVNGSTTEQEGSGS